MSKQKNNQGLGEDQMARELAKAHREVSGLDDFNIGAGENSGTPDSEDSNLEYGLNEKLESAKKVMKLLAKVRPTSSPAMNDTTPGGVNPEAAPRNLSSRSFVSGELAVGEMPTTIGRFSVTKLLGQGGFGLVFLARDPDLGRQVALKVPTFESLLNEDAQIRFKQESRVVAALSHPNIVPVFEVGNDGPISYIAAEYIEGTDLSKWIATHGPVSPELAAKTVAVIADAIQHAHSRDVIHRDLKPANILLQIDDENNNSINTSNASFDPTTIRVADFGLAKLLAQSDNTLTRTGSVVGTPAYSAPEQLQTTAGNQSNESVDIYSLGAVLYCLVTGNAPFKRSSVVEMIRNVQTLIPVSPQKENPAVPDDLAAICLKCLEKSPRDRYANIHEARKDLLRFLDGEPVVARPVPAYQRAMKWCRRNPAIASLTSLTMIAIIGGLLASLWYANNARVAAKRWQAAEAEARVDARTANETSHFMIDLFKTTNPLEIMNPKKVQGKNVTAEVILKRGVKQIKNRLHDEPEVRAELMNTLGEVCLQLGMYQDAKSLLEESLKIKTDNQHTSEIDLGIAYLKLGRCYRHLDREQDAIKHIRIANEMLGNHRDARPSVYANSLNEMGLLLMDTNYEKARDYLNQAREITARENGEPEFLWLLDSTIATLDYKNGNVEKARDGIQSALGLAERMLGTDHPRLEPVISNLAFMEKKLENYQAAIELQERGLELIRNDLGRHHPSLVGGLINLVQICQKTNQLEAAVMHGEELVQIADQSLPKEHRYIAIAIKAHANTHFRMDNFEAARSLALRNLANLKGNQAPPAIANRLKTYVLLARIERSDKQYNMASEYIEKLFSNQQIDSLDGTKIEALFERLFLLAELSTFDNESNTPREEVQEAFKAAIEFAPTTNISPELLAFNNARYFAIIGKQQQSLQYFEEAVQLGFADLGLLDDDDFDSIRSNDAFKRLLIKN